MFGKRLQQAIALQVEAEMAAQLDRDRKVFRLWRRVRASGYYLLDETLKQADTFSGLEKLDMVVAECCRPCWREFTGTQDVVDVPELPPMPERSKATQVVTKPDAYRAFETEEEPKKGFPPIYRMSRCKKCSRYNRPCLTVDEAKEIMEDETRRSYNGDAVCDECCQKSIRSANKKLGDEPTMATVNGKAIEDMTIAEMDLEIERIMNLMMRSQ